MSDTSDVMKEIRTRGKQVRQTFSKMKKFFSSPDLSLDFTTRIYYYRRKLKISWKQTVTNAKVLISMQEKKEILTTTKKRKTLYLGHVMSGERYEILKLIMEGKRSIDREQNSWLKYLRRCPKFN